MAEEAWLYDFGIRVKRMMDLNKNQHLQRKIHPISLRPLWESLCVFWVLGFFMAIALGVGASLDLDTQRIVSVAMEPLSIYSFGILSVVGFFCLIVCNMTVATTAAEMHASRWVKNVCLPITNSGLGAGAIIVGMSAGLAGGMICCSVVDPQAWTVAKVFAGIAVMVTAVLYPIVWMGRSMFDESDRERKISTLVGAAYCVALFATIWYLDAAAFWMFVLALVALSILCCLLFYVMKRKSSKRKISRL